MSKFWKFYLRNIISSPFLQLDYHHIQAVKLQSFLIHFLLPSKPLKIYSLKSSQIDFIKYRSNHNTTLLKNPPVISHFAWNGIRTPDLGFLNPHDCHVLSLLTLQIHCFVAVVVVCYSLNPSCLFSTEDFCTGCNLCLEMARFSHN